MVKHNTQFDFGDGWEPDKDFVLYEHLITDRGSTYSVSIGRVSHREDIKAFLKKLKTSKTYAKATHHSWAVRIAHEGVLYESKSDDGEKGAGQVILRVMQGENVTNGIVCVTRWFGGVQLMGDRFKHLQDAARYAIEHSRIPQA